MHHVSRLVETLSNSGQFGRVKREGRTWAVGPLVLNAAPNGGETVRCGFITGKKIGNAVKRNRARRLLQEAIRYRLPFIKPGWDLVWIARHSIVEMGIDEVAKAVDELLSRGRLFAQAEQGGIETGGAQSRIIYKSAQVGQGCILGDSSPESVETASTPET